MKLQVLNMLSVLSYATAGIGQSTPLSGCPTDIELEYPALYTLCTSGDNNTFVGVLYSNGTSIAYKYGQCIPYALDDQNQNVVCQATFCKDATCYNNGNSACTGGTIPPVPVPVTEFLLLANAADFAQYLGNGGTCYANGLSSEPLPSALPSILSTVRALIKEGR